MEDASISVVVDFDGCIDAAGDDEVDHRAILSCGGDFDGLLRRQVIIDRDVVGFGPIEVEGISAFAVSKLQRQHAHSDEIGAVDSFVAGGQYGSDAQQVGSLGGPIAGRPGSVFGSGEHDERRAIGLVLVGGFVDRHLITAGQVGGQSTFGPGCHEVSEPDIGKRASGHHAIVAPPAAVAVEVIGRDAMLLQEQSGGRVVLDGTGGRDVVGGHAVVDTDEDTGAGDTLDRRRFGGHVDKERRFLDVGALCVPLKDVPGGSGDGLPLGWAFGCGLAVAIGVHLW